MRMPFLALLSDGPRHGYDLKLALEERFGSTLPPINAGQIYTTLQRLERDGLVQGDGVPERRTAEKRVYRTDRRGPRGARGLGG